MKHLNWARWIFLLPATLFAADYGKNDTGNAVIYQKVRYNDDITAVKNGTSDDFWDPIKYIPLALANDSYLSFGGQVRVRGEDWNNFGFNDANDDDFFLYRLLLHADAHLYPGLRIFVEGKSAQADDRDLPGGRRPADVDTLDLLNAFVDLSTELGASDITLRAGRQELLYGKQRLIAPSDWGNTRRTFDGVKGIWKYDTWQVDAFWTRLVQVQKYEFNDGDSDIDLYGIYATDKLSALKANVDWYWLALDKETAKFGEVSGQEERYTTGLRLDGVCGASGFDYDVEGGYQYGDFENSDIQAYFFAGQLGYKLQDCPATPRLYVGYDYASGDDNATDDELGTFNQLYPLGHSYFGYIDIVGRQNIIDTSAGVNFKPLEKLQVRLDGHFFERAETEDALYDSGGNVVRTGDSGTSRDIGSEIDLLITYQYNTHTLLAGGYSHFFAGDFIDESGDSEDIDFVYGSVQYTF